MLVRKTQEGCGNLGGENPGAFSKAGPIFQQPFSLPESVRSGKTDPVQFTARFKQGPKMAVVASSFSS